MNSNDSRLHRHPQRLFRKMYFPSLFSSIWATVVASRWSHGRVCPLPLSRTSQSGICLHPKVDFIRYHGTSNILDVWLIGFEVVLWWKQLLVALDRHIFEHLTFCFFFLTFPTSLLLHCANAVLVWMKKKWARFFFVLFI